MPAQASELRVFTTYARIPTRTATPGNGHHRSHLPSVATPLPVAGYGLMLREIGIGIGNQEASGCTQTV